VVLDGTRRIEAERLATAFSTRVVRALSSADPSSVAPRLSWLATAVDGDQGATLGSAFDRAFEVLGRDYRNEYYFKSQLVSKIVFGRHSPRTSSALIELPMGKSCADMMIINGTSTIYEIKTDFDDFSRLTGQLADYCTRADRVNVVVSEAKASAAERSLSESIGVIAVRKRGQLTTVREGISHLWQIDTDQLFQLLRTNEAARIVQRTHRYEATGPSGLAWPLMRELFSELPVEVAHRETLIELRSRGQVACRLTSTPTFPASLRCLAYAAELSTRGSERLLDRLRMPVLSFA
jgi:hypothetical protein